MSTGQTGLRAAAESARQDKLEERRESGRKDRERSLTNVIEKRYGDRFGGFGRLEAEGVEVPEPDEGNFEYVKDVRAFAGHRSGKIEGWKVIVDGVPFLFGLTHNHSSLFLIHTCPKCGVEGASTFHGLDDLGRLLKFGPTSWSHTCLESETREVAYAIGSAARDLNLSANEVVDEAFNLHGDLIRRLMLG